MYKKLKMVNIIQKYKDKNQKLTLIIGSGFHRQGLGNNSILSNWEILLSKLTNNNSLSGNYTLDFEQIIINQTTNQKNAVEKQAYEIEKNELKHIAKFINTEQKWVLQEINRYNYPDIFNPKYVSDVISLNFDHVAEELCNSLYGKGKKLEWKNESSFTTEYKPKSTASIYLRTSYREINDVQGNKIRFWYPHGSILNSNSITLGINRYAKLVEDVTRIRNHYKKEESKTSEKEIVDLTWYSQILKNPVLILGASFSEAEWGLWSALNYKRRNFAKLIPTRYENNVFKMTDNNLSNVHLSFWYQQLFEGIDFSEQWKIIENTLKD
jgi:hypothetical protein